MLTIENVIKLEEEAVELAELIMESNKRLFEIFSTIGRAYAELLLKEDKE